MVVPDAQVVPAPAEPAEPELQPSRYTRRLRGTTPEDAEAAYTAARDAWVAAMKAANSGRAADLASLAIAQETYEAAAADRERWIRVEPTRRTAIPVDGSGTSRELDVIVDQELGWRHVNDEKPARGLGRLFRRRRGG